MCPLCPWREWLDESLGEKPAAIGKISRYSCDISRIRENVFKEHLQKVVDDAGGGVGAVVMGLDGIAVETYIRERGGVDIDMIVVEFSYILTEVNKAASTLHVGGIEEIIIRAEQLTLVIRMLNEEYFVAVAMTHRGNLGKCRFLLRLVAPRLISELL